MPPAKAPEAVSRVVIDAQLRDAQWNLADGRSVRLESVLSDGTRPDYVLCDRHGRSLAVVEAKRMATDPLGAERQARDYAGQLDAPFVFLANGKEIWFWDYEREAHPHLVKTFFSQPDLERRAASRAVRRDLASVAIDRKIADRPYQRECIDALCNEVTAGRRKLLVEMATGTGKTRTAAALIKRLFDAGVVTRVLFLVDRIPLARQTEDAFAEYLPSLPAYVLRAGRRFEDQKRITITTLQSMVNSYADYSSGYFDLVVSDECHRSIYGKWSGVLKHFDGIQVGLTATPCVASPEVMASLDDDEDRAFVRDTLRFFEVDRPTYRYPLKRAIQEGYLVPYRIYHAMTVRTASEGGFPVSRSELDWTVMDAADREELEILFGETDVIAVDPNALERRFTIPQRNRAIVQEFRDVVLNGYTSTDGVRRFPQDGKTIVFAVTKRHAAALAQMFDDAFADRKPSPDIRYADFVVSDTGADDTANAMDKIKRFKKEKFPQILVSVNMLDTGFDYPEVVNLVMARFTKSAILYQQMRGRGTRRADSIKKTAFTVFDFTGVTAFHGDNEDVPADGGFVVTTERKAEQGQRRGLLVLDINDHIDPATRGWVTLDDEGNEIRSAEAPDLKAAELGARFEAWILAREAFSPDQIRLLRMAGETIRANASDLESFEPYHFANDPFRGMGGRRYAERLFGGPEGLGRVLADLNAAVFQADAGSAPEAEPPRPTA
ncbi:MAG: DEAD/DEAH box helicase family protein [Caulobacteraceae bacterium]|nr:DEAD/DEAH box helicase family protein [Caulobacteraceae bacterium]